MIVGIDGFPTMFKAISSGLTQATKAQNPYLMGEMAVRDAILFMNGKGAGVPAQQYVEAQLITKKNVDQANPATFYGPHATSMY